MKRITSIILALVMCLCLASCGGKDRIEETIGLINSIKVPVESGLLAAEEAYNSLSERQKEKVTNYGDMVSARERIDGIRSRNWDAEKVESRIAGLASADFDDATAFEGTVYRTREIGERAGGYIDVGPYNNVAVKTDYAMTIEFDVRVDDYDTENGYPLLVGYVNSEKKPNYAVGYDFIEGCFFTGSLTGISDSTVEEYRAKGEGGLTLGVWHHLKIVYRQTAVSAELDGVEVLNFRYEEGIGYLYYVFYPQWIDATLANVVFTSGVGVASANAFDMNHAATEGSWSTVELDEATVGESNRAAVAEARTAYDALSEADRALVGNYDVLAAAEARVAEQN